MDDVRYDRYSSLIVGLDYFGNEKARPYCPFAHTDFLDFLITMRKRRKSQFGFRYHCGEWDQNLSVPSDRLLAHMTISSRVIRKVLEHVKSIEQRFNDIVPIRIGHGVAFRHWLKLRPFSSNEDQDFARRTELDEEIRATLCMMRDMAAPIEINLTSNQILVEFEPGFHHDLIREGYTVVLCTDNHGIWDCSQVQQPDGTYRFPSIAGEYYSALKNVRSPISQHVLSAADVRTLVNGGGSGFCRWDLKKRMKVAEDALRKKAISRMQRENAWIQQLGGATRMGQNINELLAKEMEKFKPDVTVNRTRNF